MEAVAQVPAANPLAKMASLIPQVDDDASEALASLDAVPARPTRLRVLSGGDAGCLDDNGDLWSRPAPTFVDPDELAHETSAMSRVADAFENRVGMLFGGVTKESAAGAVERAKEHALGLIDRQTSRISERRERIAAQPKPHMRRAEPRRPVAEMLGETLFPEEDDGLVTPVEPPSAVSDVRPHAPRDGDADAPLNPPLAGRVPDWLADSMPRDERIAILKRQGYADSSFMPTRRLGRAPDAGSTAELPSAKIARIAVAEDAAREMEEPATMESDVCGNPPVDDGDVHVVPRIHADVEKHALRVENPVGSEVEEPTDETGSRDFTHRVEKSERDVENSVENSRPTVENRPKTTGEPSPERPRRTIDPALAGRYARSLGELRGDRPVPRPTWRRVFLSGGTADELLVAKRMILSLLSKTSHLDEFVVFADAGRSAIERLSELTRTRLAGGRPYYDVMVQLSGWQADAACRLESSVAEACGIRRIALSGVERELSRA